MAKRKNRIQKIPDPSDDTLLTRMVYCGSCGRLMRRRRITHDYHEPTFCCVYDNEDLPEDKLDAYEEYTAGTLSLEEYHKRKAQLNRQGNACHEKIENLKTQEAALNSGIIPHEMQMITESAKEFQYANALSREMVTTFVDAIFLYDTHYEIRWKYQDVWEQLQKHQNEKSKEKKE